MIFKEHQTLKEKSLKEEQKPLMVMAGSLACGRTGWTRSVFAECAGSLWAQSWRRRGSDFLQKSFESMR